jgi:hypothetical protein
MLNGLPTFKGFLSVHPPAELALFDTADANTVVVLEKLLQNW